METTKQRKALAQTVRNAGELLAPRAEAQPIPAGARLDHFVVGELLGTGGMGAVYLAHDTSLDRPVALKILRDDHGGVADVHHERFFREARTQASISHPNVVQIYYIGYREARDGLGPLLFFAMELVEGDTLEAIIDDKSTMPPEDARRAMMQVVRGLRAGQQAGIIHRDVKPSNILRGRDGRLKIADFGLAKALEEDHQHSAQVGFASSGHPVPPHATADTVPAKPSKRLTHEGMLLGSPWYVAPEQARAEAVDHRADMYALGASFFHLLTGEPLFDGGSALQVATAHALDEADPVADRMRAKGLTLPAALARIVDRLLAKDPRARFDSYDALLQALEEAAPKSTEYAGFWARGAATLIDGLVGAALVTVFSWPGVLAHLAYVTVAHTWKGQTLGKYLLRMEVRRRDAELGEHERLEWARSAARTVVAMWLPFVAAGIMTITGGTGEVAALVERLSLDGGVTDVQDTLVVVFTTTGGFLTLLYLGGLAMAGFNPRKRALHDLVAGSVVVYRL